jgi:hypothetical protein
VEVHNRPQICNLFSQHFCCCCDDINSSPFCKGIMCADRAAKMGYSWRMDNDRKIRFWEDQWFGSCSLTIQFWGLYSIINKYGRTIDEAWDGVNLKFTFRRTLNRDIMDQWLELLQIASSIHLIDDEDVIIWQYKSSARFSIQPLYAQSWSKDFRGLERNHKRGPFTSYI